MKRIIAIISAVAALCSLASCAVTPFFNRIVTDQSLTKYYLWLTLIFGIAVPFLYDLASDFLDGTAGLFVHEVLSFATNMRVHIVACYSGYFILGYVLSQRTFHKKQQRLLYLAGLIGVVFTAFLSTAAARKAQQPGTQYFQAYCINVAVQAIAVFVWFQAHITGTLPWNRLIHTLSCHALGIVLIHPFVMSVLAGLKLDSMITHPILSVPLMWVIVCLISFLITWLIRKIPRIGKYLV